MNTGRLVHLLRIYWLVSLTAVVDLSLSVAGGRSAGLNHFVLVNIFKWDNRECMGERKRALSIYTYEGGNLISF